MACGRDDAITLSAEVLRRLRAASPLGGVSHGRSDDHRNLRSALCSDQHREARRSPRVAGSKAVERNGGEVMRTADSGRIGPAMSLTARGAD